MIVGGGGLACFIQLLAVFFFMILGPDEHKSDSAHELLISAMLAVSKMAGLMGNLGMGWLIFRRLSGLGLVKVKLIDGGKAGTAEGFEVIFARFNKLFTSNGGLALFPAPFDFGMTLN